MKYKAVLTFLLAIFFMKDFSSQEKRDTIPISVIEVCDTAFYTVLDTVIETRSKVYPLKSNLYTIWFGLDSVRKDLIVIQAEEERVYGANHDLGILHYKGSSFVVRGEILDTTIFCENERKEILDVSPPSIFRMENGEPVFLRFYSDEIYCIWYYRYLNSNFKLVAYQCSEFPEASFYNIESEYSNNK